MSQCIYDNEDGAAGTAGEHQEVVGRMRTVSIYESIDDQQGPGIGLSATTEVTESSGHQQTGCTLFRSRTLWLGLLCFILLTVIAVIQVHCRNTLQTHIKSEEEKRKQISAELNHFCKDGCKAFNNSFYYISSALRSWKGSRQDCRDRGADLVVVNSSDEQEFINSLKGRLWIGLSYTAGEETWKWVDGSVLTGTGFWAKGQPFIKSGQKNSCVNTAIKEGIFTFTPKGWNTDDCGKTQQWICEKVND